MTLTGSDEWFIEQTSQQPRDFKIPVENLGKLEDKIKKLNKKASKCGTSPCRIIYGEKVFEKVHCGDNDPDAPLFAEEYREYQMVRVEGDAPVLNGWKLIGKLEPHESGTPIVKSAPGESVPKKYYKSAPHCDHCGVKRYRRDTFIVEKDGETKQVGRACLKDFTGHRSPEQLAAYAQWLYDLKDELDEMERDLAGSYDPGRLNEFVMTLAIAAIERDGFRGANFDGQTTKGTMWDHIHPPTGPAAANYVPLKLNEAQHTTAKEAITWLKAAAAKEPDSEFWQNIGKLLSVECVKERYFGYIAGAAFTYMKELGKIAARKSIREGLVSEPVGEEGTKIKLIATVVNAHIYTTQNTVSYYDDGRRVILVAKTEDNKLIKIFSSKVDIQKDDIIKISGKIGRCEVEDYERSPFKGIMMTFLAPRARITLEKAHDAK